MSSECLRISFILLGSLTCLKSLRKGTNGFTSAPKEVVLLIFYCPEVNLRPWPGFNPRTLGQVASMMTAISLKEA
jgi:hypothetical protein